MPARERCVDSRTAGFEIVDLNVVGSQLGTRGAHGDGNVVLDMRLLIFVRPCETDGWFAALCFKIDFRGLWV